MVAHRPYLLGLAMFCQQYSYSQSDSVIYNLDSSLNVCNAKNAVITGIGIKEDNKLKLRAFYNENGLTYLEGWFTDSTLSVKHGPFVYYNNKGEKESEGFFVNNKKAGYWLMWSNGLIEDSILYRGGKIFERTSYAYFDSSKISNRTYRNLIGNIFISTEWYRNGSIKSNLSTKDGTGVETKYYENRNIESVITFLEGSLAEIKLYKKDGTEIKDSDIARKRRNSSVFEIPKGPSYPGGEAGFSSFFQRNFKPPKNFVSGMMPESVTVTFFLDKAGFAHDIKVTGASNRDLEIEIMTVFRRMAAWNMNGLPGYGPINYTINLSN